MTSDPSTESRAQVERVVHLDQTIGIIIRAGFHSDGIEFFTPNSFSQQLGYMNRPAGHRIEPHVHNPVEREVVWTQEVLLVKSGRVRVDFYTDGKHYLESRIIQTGDVILLAAGGHGFEMLEPTEMIEIKQGPYFGDQDKTRFEPVAPEQCKAIRGTLGMSSTFGLYSRYYDLLYRDKDYAAETDYIRELISEFHPAASDVLELGCGTGKHAGLLAKSGLAVTGVERSAEMIAAARAENTEMEITSGDARTVRLEQKFDVVLSLFHVVSYQITNGDVTKMFDTAAAHLRDGGCFIFDVWYGPAVLRQLPESRVKEMEDDRSKVRRIAKPTVNFNENWVDVNYSIMVTDKTSGQQDMFDECHRMRYFFAPEIDLFARASRMELVHGEQWLDRAVPSPETWGVTFILRKPN